MYAGGYHQCVLLHTFVSAACVVRVLCVCCACVVRVLCVCCACAVRELCVCCVCVVRVIRTLNKTNVDLKKYLGFSITIFW